MTRRLHVALTALLALTVTGCAPSAPAPIPTPTVVSVTPDSNSYAKAVHTRWIQRCSLEDKLGAATYEYRAPVNTTDPDVLGNIVVSFAGGDHVTFSIAGNSTSKDAPDYLWVLATGLEDHALLDANDCPYVFVADVS